MDFKQLQFLCMLEQVRHFGDAAKRCHVTQPTLSMRVRALEDELDLPLVRRGHRFEGFTPEGERILHWARQITTAQTALKAEAAAFKGELYGQVRLGQVPFSTIDLMPIIADTHKRYPHLTFSLTTDRNRALLDGLSDNTLDAVIVYDEGIVPQRHRFQRIHGSDFDILFDADHFPALATLGTLPWTAINDWPVGLLTSSYRFRKSLDQMLDGLGVVLEPLLEVDSLMAIVSAVRQGLCCAVIPSKFLEQRDLSGLMRIPMMRDESNANTLPDLGIAIKNQSPLSPISKLMFELLGKKV
ncbi:MAG: LysR family transcriptional regulator [Pseudomonadota bacterium]